MDFNKLLEVASAQQSNVDQQVRMCVQNFQTILTRLRFVYANVVPSTYAHIRYGIPVTER